MEAAIGGLVFAGFILCGILGRSKERKVSSKPQGKQQITPERVSLTYGRVTRIKTEDGEIIEFERPRKIEKTMASEEVRASLTALSAFAADPRLIQ